MGGTRRSGWTVSAWRERARESRWCRQAVRAASAGDAVWPYVNDGVMEGLSSGKMTLGEGYPTFEGVVSFDNNGGFSSVRSRPVLHDLSVHDGLTLRVRGDGNNFLLPAQSIPSLYMARWQIELFFKWPKQHLRVKAFCGTSPNAVKTQVWMAISTYLLAASLKRRHKLDLSLHTILQNLSLSVFEKVLILKVLSNMDDTEKEHSHQKQLNLFKL